jgi:hypothetical protein
MATPFITIQVRSLKCILWPKRFDIDTELALQTNRFGPKLKRHCMKKLNHVQNEDACYNMSLIFMLS